MSNPRHERFAQEYAKGRTGRDAYLASGYDCTAEAADVGASKLLRTAKVSARVAELQSRGANRAEITIESLIDDAEGEAAYALHVAAGCEAEGADQATQPDARCCNTVSRYSIVCLVGSA